MTKRILVTGAAGFLGAFLSKALLNQGYQVYGIDNLNDYYDPTLKEARLEMIRGYDNFTFEGIDLADKKAIMTLFETQGFDIVVNLAAQAGVRYSIENPDVYIESNINGFFNILEACRHYPVEHLLYASSSSVYGANKKVPFSEDDRVDSPVSLYAASKRTNELMAETYSHLYKIPASGLRFFTVYGPMGRPDMAYFIFANKYFKGEPIHIYNDGDFEKDLYRDFTFIDDIVDGIIALMGNPPMESGDKSAHEIYNIGNNQPEKLMVMIQNLEDAFSQALNRPVVFDKVYEPIKPGDVPATYADISKLNRLVGFEPKTSLRDGLQVFADWYVDYYSKK